MRIVIDLQGAQSKSRNRGIGRYSVSFAKGIIRNRGSHEVLIALNGLFTDTIEPIRGEFDGLLPQQNIRVWHSPGPVNQIDSANRWRRQSAELVREAFLASLQPDIVHVSSLFEGLEDDAVTSIGMFTQAVTTSVTLYDLIPFIHRRPYLENPVIESWYLNKLGHLRRAHLWLAISESSRQEGIEFLGLPKERSVNVSTAADEHFQMREVGNKTELAIRDRYGLNRSFVMYTGGIDHRKNIEGLIRAYSLLPKDLRERHQLAVVCSAQPDARNSLLQLAKQLGFAPDEVVLTGFVPEDDLVNLYNLCKVFVFPSWHEGFGLPVLEAMHCGAPIIGANTSGLPEVIGREDALFDPYNDRSIAEKISEVLTDDVYRKSLVRHGREQAKRFSWDATAKHAIAAFEELHVAQPRVFDNSPARSGRPKLAYISPLPPERSGIADYSAELLPELARHYDIDVIISQDLISDPWIRANCGVRSVDWFVDHAAQFERILYHFGNSPYHQHMFALLDRFPGVVALHDFFLGHIVAHMDAQQFPPNGWAMALYRSHGYRAVEERFHITDSSDVVWKYPCNLQVLRGATGIIVHSEFSRRLANEWYGAEFASNWSVIPLMRERAKNLDRIESRRTLALSDDAFVVCSFGMLAPTKQNHRLLDAWLSSDLARDERCILAFVGENNGGDYGSQLLAAIRRSGIADRIRITGWARTEQFRQYLASADLAVQLRTLSRGETSAAVLDCMNYGLPTIVNANGAMADLLSNAVWKLPDAFADTELVSALETLRADCSRRDTLSACAREVIRAWHAPRDCANHYFEAIERFYRRAEQDLGSLASAIARLDVTPDQPEPWRKLSKSIAQSLLPRHPMPQLLVDVSVLAQLDSKTGIQRVVRSILAELLANPPAGFRVEPVYATMERIDYRYARQFTLRFLDCWPGALEDELVEVSEADIFLGLDLQSHVVPRQIGFFDHLRRIGVQVQFVVYDLLPLSMPNCFSDGMFEWHDRWLAAIARADGALCISRSVADELPSWLNLVAPKRSRPFRIGWFHLGADIASSVPSVGLPDEAGETLAKLLARPTFLTVGTVEPRKGYSQLLAAYEQLWGRGMDVNLAIVGQAGWKVGPLIENLRRHPEINRRLFWFEGITDEYLERIYRASRCLILASEGEGFGLPLIEAARHQLPIIARDIPVFREVAGDHAFYFSGKLPEHLANAVHDWLTLDKSGSAPKSTSIPWLTWRQSTQQLLDALLNRRSYLSWLPDSTSRYRGSDNRFRTHVGRREGQHMLSTGCAGFLIFGPYLELEAGLYQVKIFGTAGAAVGDHSRADVAMNKGKLILAETTLIETDPNGCLATLSVQLAASCADLEVRVWVDGDATVTVSQIAVEPYTFERRAAA